MCYYANKLEQGGVHAHTMFALFENGISMLQSECLEMVSGMMAYKCTDILCVCVNVFVSFCFFGYYFTLLLLLLLLLFYSIVLTSPICHSLWTATHR